LLLITQRWFETIIGSELGLASFESFEVVRVHGRQIINKNLGAFIVVIK
jgi:hypothetical protein